MAYPALRTQDQVISWAQQLTAQLERDRAAAQGGLIIEPGISGGALTVDLRQGDTAWVELDQDVSTFTIIPPRDTERQRFDWTLVLKQGTGGGRTVAWPGGFIGGPELSTEAGAVDVIHVSTIRGIHFVRTAGVSSGGSSRIRPEDFGAVGDGEADDSEAFDEAIATAIADGKTLQGDPSKVYLIEQPLASFGSTLRLSDIHFRAPNQVRILLGDPTWPAENTSVTSLSSTTIGASVITRVNLSSTSGLAVGDWVLVGSSTVRWPGSPNTFWFEAAQIIDMTANTSLTLHRRLVGEVTGGLNASLRLFKIPDYQLDATNLRFSCAGDPMVSGQTFRQFAIELRGGVGHRLTDISADSWWSRLIVFRCAMRSRVRGLTWEILPDVTLSSSEALGYGVHDEAGAYGTHVSSMTGGICRHGYTNSAFGTPTYDPSVPYRYGVPSNPFISDSMVFGGSNAPFDTHIESIGAVFMNCKSMDPVRQLQTNAGAPMGFQNRGYRTRYIGCAAQGGQNGFRDNTAMTDWGVLGENIAEYSACSAQDLAGAGLFFEGSIPGSTILVNGFTVSHAAYALQSGAVNNFAGDCYVRGLLQAELSTAIYQNGGHTGNVVFLDP